MSELVMEKTMEMIKTIERKVVVTGGAQGIGKSIARRLGSEGYSVVIADRNTEVGEATAEELAELGIDTSFLRADVGDEKSVKKLFAGAAEKMNGLHVVVNGAGITGNERTFMKMSDVEQARLIIAVNLMGTMAVTQAALPYIKETVHGDIEENGGRVINISSIVAGRGNRGQTGYGASKAGVEGFTLSLAREMRFGTANCVAPGFTETLMLSDVPQTDLDAFAQSAYSNRLGEARDIANAVAFFADPRSAYVTGQVLGVNGGQVL